MLTRRDIKTIPTVARARVVAGLVMPGVFILHWTISMSAAIDDIALVADASGADEWADRVIYLPLR